MTIDFNTDGYMSVVPAQPAAAVSGGFPYIIQNPESDSAVYNNQPYFQDILSCAVKNLPAYSQTMYLAEPAMPSRHVGSVFICSFGKMMHSAGIPACHCPEYGCIWNVHSA